ncbi:Alkyl hydroperoxide reductase subunit C-like protein [Minicystis rosea]|nr:Alkyl hydroperoxide reductase subunit C-like protein [Minicystis rosea]
MCEKDGDSESMACVVLDAFGGPETTQALRSTIRFNHSPFLKRPELVPSTLKEIRMKSMPLLGQQAPNFSLQSTPDQRVSLADFQESPLIVAFYPADWSPVCGDQMALYNEILPEFRRLSASLVGISVDGIWCHLAFAEARRLKFPLLADFEPKGEVARRYGVYRAADGTSERALFVVDGGGVVRWSYVSPVGVNPGADGILAALEQLRG